MTVAYLLVAALGLGVLFWIVEGGKLSSAKRAKRAATDARLREELIEEIRSHVGHGDLLAWSCTSGILPHTSTETTIVAVNPDTNLMLFGLGDGFWKVLKPGDIADVVGRYVTVGGERRSGTVARSVLGGIVAGSTGAVVGALTAPTQGLGYQELRGIEIHTDDLKKPVLKLGSLIFRDDALPSVKEITPSLPESTIFLTDLLPVLLAFARRRSIARPISTVRAEWPEGQSNRAGAGVEEDVDRRYCTDCGASLTPVQRYCATCGTRSAHTS